MSGIPSYYDGWVNSISASSNGEDLARYDRHTSWAALPRFQSYKMRRSIDTTGLDAKRRSEIPRAVMIASQGVRRVPSWRGHLLYKSVFDLAILTELLAEVRPVAIVEAGSGTGASALWLADMARALSIRTMIFSIDLARATASDPDVSFFEGNAADMAHLFGSAAARGGPMLVLEDAHSEVGAVLDQADAATSEGDYILVEDSVGKGATLERFLANKAATYLVDSHYTDFFGRNATSCVDSIFRRMS